MNFTTKVRIADNVLEEEDWPVGRITVEDGVVTDITEVNRGAYRLPDMVGWDIEQLQDWIDTDCTGYHPENFYDIWYDGEWKSLGFSIAEAFADSIDERIGALKAKMLKGVAYFKAGGQTYTLEERSGYRLSQSQEDGFEVIAWNTWAVIEDKIREIMKEDASSA